MIGPKDQDLRREDVMQELVFDLESNSVDVRKLAVIWLSQMGDASAVPHLQRMTSDPDVAVRYFARRGLDDVRRRTGELDPAEAEDPLALLRSASPEDRVRGALFCYDRRDPALLRQLLEMLPVEEDVRVRATLVKAIGFSGDPAVVPILLPYLIDADPRVRANTLEALDPYGAPEIVEKVMLLIQDADNRVQANVVLFLSKREPGLVAETVRRMLDSNLVWMQESALYALGRVRADWCREILSERLRSGLPAALEQKVRRALAELAQESEPARSDEAGRGTEPGRGDDAGDTGPAAPGEAASLPGPGEQPIEPASSSAQPGGGASPRVTPLTDGLETFLDVRQWARAMIAEDYRLRLHAVQNAFLFASGGAVNLLARRAAEERHPFVQSSLVKALGEIGGPEQIPAITPFLASEDDRVRANAIEGLAMIDSSQACDAVRPLLHDPSPRVRANAAKLVHRSDRTRGWETLRQMVLSGDPGSIRAALHSLDRLGPEEVLGIFGLALESSSQEVQLNVMSVLESATKTSGLARDLLERLRKGGFSGAREAELEGLLEQMNHPAAQTRLDALRRLAPFEDERAWDQIALSCTDRDALVREEARRLTSMRGGTDSRRETLSSLGLTVYRMLREKEASLPGAETLLEEIAGIDAQIDAGFSLNVAHGLRTGRMVELADLALDLHGRGELGLHDLAEAIGDFRAREMLLQSAAKTEGAGSADRPAGNGARTEGAARANGTADRGDRSPAAAESRATSSAARFAARNAARTVAMTRGSPMEGRFSSVRAYWLLIVPLAALVGLVALVGYDVAARDPVESRAGKAGDRVRPPPSQSLIEKIASAPDVGRFAGLGIRWTGEVTGISEDRSRLELSSAGHRVDVEFASPLNEPPPVGAVVGVSGIVKGRVDGRILLDGRSLLELREPEAGAESEVGVEE